LIWRRRSHDQREFKLLADGDAQLSNLHDDPLRPEDERLESPTFFVWTPADLMGAALARVQVIKGWIDEEGQPHKDVRDDVCSGGLEMDQQQGDVQTTALRST
jgi:hypothetical protein